MHSHYLHLIDSNKITIDPAQETIINRLYLLRMAFLAYERARKRKKFGIFARDISPPRGLYIYGDVGRGKSMLMDLFFNDVPIAKKRRVHFHTFMQEVHAALHAWRKGQKHRGEKDADPLSPLAKQIASSCQLLCFDELQVTDIADAMILGRLFKELFKRGVVMVATSNRHPDDLYVNGLQREHFLPCIELIKKRLHVVHLGAAQDYRRGRMASVTRLYHAPLGEEADQFAEGVFNQLTGNALPKDVLLTIHGRELCLPYSDDEVTLCTFHELCENPLGAADYLAIAERFSVLILVDIPLLSKEKRNEAKRLVTLIDVMYEHKVLCIFTAEAVPDALYPEGDGAFEFQRTASRMMEMQSEEYRSLVDSGALLTVCGKKPF